MMSDNNLSLVLRAIEKMGGALALAEELATAPETVWGWQKHPERTNSIGMPTLDKMRKIVGNGVITVPNNARVVIFKNTVNRGDGNVAYGIGVVTDVWDNVFIPNAKLMQLDHLGIQEEQGFVADLEPGIERGFKLSVVKIYRAA
jgi:hypothetical protein